MNEIYKLTDLKDTMMSWIPLLRRSGFIFYGLVTLFFVAGFLAMFFIHVDISIRASGIILSERMGLMAECYVPSKNIGFLKPGLPARFQIDAYNYNYFGSVNGYIFSISDDFILIDRIPVYKVNCHFNSISLKLRNGYIGHLKKGMGFQVRFITCRRTLWQLLFDTVDDWLSPTQEPV